MIRKVIELLKNGKQIELKEKIHKNFSSLEKLP